MTSKLEHPTYRKAISRIGLRAATAALALAYCLLAPGASVQGQTYTTLHSFDGTDGETPTGPLVQATNGDLYSTTDVGGANVNVTTVAEGSAVVHRGNTDEDSGEVYIYLGGGFPSGTRPAAFRYLFDFTMEGNTTGYITPLLFEYHTVADFTVFTVVGIGKGVDVALDSAPQTISFDVTEGAKVTTGGNFTFGYVNAIVNSNGVPVQASPGTVDFSQPAQSGTGVGGTGTTNVWEVTATSPSPVVTLGTTFGPAGASVDYTFYPGTRTYSAIAIGLIEAE